MTELSVNAMAFLTQLYLQYEKDWHKEQPNNPLLTFSEFRESQLVQLLLEELTNQSLMWKIVHQQRKDNLKAKKQEAPTTNNGWQPIETAPLDGTWVLLRGGCCDAEEVLPSDWNRPVVAKWDQICWVYAHWDSAWRSVYVSPTEWKSIN